LTTSTPPAPTTGGGPRPSVLGLDLSLTATGIAYRDGSTGTVKTRPADGDRRLLIIAEAVRVAVGGEHIGLGPAPDLAVIEDIPQNSFAAKPISMVHGVVRTVLLEAGVPYVLITAATLKAYATGKGSGDKVPMAMAAYKRAGMEFPDDNQCDAWWLRAAGLDRLGHPLVPMPATQRARLDKACWPEAVTR
jgi:Holliday junction resolvasome RuvABC endonuclease subunit